MSVSSWMSSIGRSLTNFGQTVSNSSPKTKLVVGVALAAIALGGYLYANRTQTPRNVGIVSRESTVLPSDIFLKKPSRADGTNLYQKAQELSGRIRTERMGKGEVRQALTEMHLDPHEKVQVLGLVQAEYYYEFTPQFKMLAELKDELTVSHAPAKPVETGPSPKEVSLREGKLPAIDHKFKQNLISYLKNEGPASALNITPETHKEALQQIKIFDLELDRMSPQERDKLKLKLSTYELRTRCLVASQGQMPSFEAYTKSIDRKYFDSPFSSTSREYASKQENYVPERVAIHAQLTMRYLSDMTGLSRRFNNDEPTMYALSGNTAVGKSFMAKNDEDFMRGVDESGEATGALNPDTVKAMLRKDVDGVTNQQIHIEGFALNRKLADEMHNKALQTSMVIDERLGTVSATKDLIGLARSSGKQLVIKDIDAPLKVSAMRVLGRDVKTDPCVPFGPIAGGYKNIRKERAEVIQMMVQSPEVKSYELYVMDESGRSGLAARKVPATATEDARLEIVDQDLYDYALSGEKKAEKDIQALKQAPVDETLYGPYVDKGVKVEPLQRYKGCSMEQALMQHSLVLPQWGAVTA